jgi:DDE superfamily endonuclease
MRVTVKLTGRSDGYKCKPYVLLARKRPVPAIAEKYRSKLVLSWAGKVWMDDELTADYLQRVLGMAPFNKRLLVWDSFRCHISEATKRELRRLRLYTAVVPGGCTKFVQVRFFPVPLIYSRVQTTTIFSQPADVSWNGPFKARIQERYNLWMPTGDGMEWTAGGNPLRPPPIDTYLDWICDAWDSIPKEAIQKLFKGMFSGGSVLMTSIAISIYRLWYNQLLRRQRGREDPLLQDSWTGADGDVSASGRAGAWRWWRAAGGGDRRRRR